MTEPSALDRMSIGWLNKYVAAWDKYQQLCVHRASTSPERIAQAYAKASKLQKELNREACRDIPKAPAKAAA